MQMIRLYKQNIAREAAGLKTQWAAGLFHLTCPDPVAICLPLTFTITEKKMDLKVKGVIYVPQASPNGIENNI